MIPLKSSYLQHGGPEGGADEGGGARGGDRPQLLRARAARAAAGGHADLVPLPLPGTDLSVKFAINHLGFLCIEFGFGLESLDVVHM